MRRRIPSNDWERRQLLGLFGFALVVFLVVLLWMALGLVRFTATGGIQ